MWPLRVGPAAPQQAGCLWLQLLPGIQELETFSFSFSVLVLDASLMGIVTLFYKLIRSNQGCGLLFKPGGPAITLSSQQGCNHYQTQFLLCFIPIKADVK